MNKEEIKKIIKENDISYIRMQFTDMLGDIKAVEIPVNRIDDALNNRIMFDGSSIEGFVRIKEADMYLHPDLDTFLVLPFEDSAIGGVARFICDVYRRSVLLLPCHASMSSAPAYLRRTDRSNSRPGPKRRIRGIPERTCILCIWSCCKGSRRP